MSTLADRIAYWIDADEHLRGLVELLQRDEIDERWAGALDEAVGAASALIDSSGPRLFRDRPEPRKPSRKASGKRSGATVRNHDSGTMTKDRRPAGRAAPSAQDPHTTELAVVLADRDMSVRDLAAAADVAQSVVYRVLSGKGSTAATQRKLAAALDVEPPDLFLEPVTEPVTEPSREDAWSDSDPATGKVARPLRQPASTATRLTGPTGQPVKAVEPRSHGSHSADGHPVRTAP